jgi:hypothetical protein
LGTKPDNSIPAFGGAGDCCEMQMNKKITSLKSFIFIWLFWALMALAVNYFSKLPYWIAFGIILFLVIVNGIVINYEDKLPSGWENPMSTQSTRQLTATQDFL